MTCWMVGRSEDLAVKHTPWIAVSLLALSACPDPRTHTHPPINRVPVVQPVFGTPVTAEVTPPAISGGTLIISRDQRRAIAADPDRDAVFITALDGSTSPVRVALSLGDEPGRLVEDGRGRVHVALRGASHVAVIDLESGAVVERREACRTPRGLAFDAEQDLVHVACATGELVTFRAATGEVTRRLTLERDLRDVVVLARGRLAVSRFRSSEILEVSTAGTIASRALPTTVERSSFGMTRIAPPGGGSSARVAPAPSNAVPHVAWRMVPAGDRLLVLHQRALDKPVEIVEGGYGSGGGLCGVGGSIVETAVSTFSTAGTFANSTDDIQVSAAVLAVDMAVSTAGKVAFAVPGNARVPGRPQIVVTSSASTLPRQRCITPTNPQQSAPGQATAVAFAGERLVVQLRQPAALFFPDSGQTITLSPESREDTGHTIFHANAGGGLACASCHAEGDDDGHTWNFASIGPRRTQTFRGGLSGTEPFHWDGDMQGIGHLMNSVFSERMSGPVLNVVQVATLQQWIDRMPARQAPRTMDDAATRGRALFFDSRVACNGCHSGASTTNNQTVNVGTGAAFQVPTLRGIAWRAPFMHNGCAPTLRDRFTNPACGGGDQHGITSHLSATQIDDLVAFLETL
jgi:hypothetical protein